MLCFDKLKIITSSNYIKEIDRTAFQSISTNEKLQYHKYRQNTPYSLLIMNNYEHNELAIEFTSKILKDNFIHLINKDTIYECLHNINQLGIFKLDIENIINHAKVVKCDTVKDVIFQNIKALKNCTNSNLCNYNKWKTGSYSNGFVIKNVVGTRKYKHRIIVYDKGKELSNAKNQSFLNTLSDKEQCLLHYKNKIRIEQNINTENQIRDLLGISDNQLINVLNSNTNPILTVLNKALKAPVANTYVVNSLKEHLHKLMLEDCNNDLEQVEAKVRNLCSKNTSITKMMQPYRELHHRLQENAIPTFDIRKLVA
jgi:hypothetical protein